MTRSYAVLIALGLLLGAIVGIWQGQPSAGTVIGGALGALATLLLRWRDARR